jgi:hypothetical protein
MRRAGQVGPRRLTVRMAAATSAAVRVRKMALSTVG